MSTLRYLPLDLLAASGLILLLSSYFYYVKTRGRAPLPPGPRSLPFIGNTFDLPQGKAWETYNRWADKFGDIVHVKTVKQSIIILNSFETISDLLESKSNIYSGRPYMTMFHELMGLGGGTAFLPYGTQWRKHRKLYHQQMNPVAVREFHPSLLSAVRNFLKLLLVNPSNYEQHLRHLAGGIVMNIAYGHEIAAENDEYIALSGANAPVFSKAIRPGAFLVDTFPILKYVPEWCPGADFQKVARITRQNVNRAREVPFRNVQTRMAAGTAKPSFVAKSLTALGTVGDSSELNEDIEAIKRVAAGMFGAGIDTTTITITAFLLAMILYPDVQRKAQLEIDSVIGHERLPNFSDRPHLPYISCIIKEVMRWFLVAPTALTHVTTEEDIYRGYRIPLGSLVVPNVWRVMNDPKVYPEPRRFWPERFLPDEKGNIARDPTVVGAFGFGRRVCAGRNLADASIWLMVVSILFSFEIAEDLGENSHKMDKILASDPIPGFFR
ncbi:cytochrome P450 [Hysterangium stoloniferum]|nr:cytochrome P450 [Hysterangium stoloniferum]